MANTPTEKAEKLVDGVVEDARTRLVNKHENLIEEITETLSQVNYRELNVVFSEARRRVEEEKQ